MRYRAIKPWLQTAVLLLCGLCCVSCSEPVTEADDSAARPPTWAGQPATGGPLAVTHGGAGSPGEWSPDCQAAAEWALVALEENVTALEAAAIGTMVMENNCRFNAGTGANIRLDGATIQMDAAVMTSDGEFAAVAVIERVRNPVLVARAVLETPHRLLAGEGATRFAHQAGFADLYPACPEAEAKYRQRIRWLLTGEQRTGFENFDWRRFWNYAGPPPRPIDSQPAAPAASQPAGEEIGDTVGTVVRDQKGDFAATLSTGGTSITLYGRVGDVPIYGCGCYAGPAGAVACTGYGEEIIRRTMARTVYDLLASGVPARQAVRQGVAMFPAEHSLGLIAVGNRGWGVAANRDMAYGIAHVEPTPQPGSHGSRPN